MPDVDKLKNSIHFFRRVFGWVFCGFISWFLGQFLGQSFCWFLYEFDHGLWTPNEVFFHWIPELLGLGKQIGQINCGAFGVFSAKLQESELSVPILVQWLHVFHYSSIISEKLNFYNYIQNIYMGLRFEFGLQRINDLAFAYP